MLMGHGEWLADRKYLYSSMMEAESDGELLTIFGSIPYLKGDKIATNWYGDQKIIPKGQDDEYYLSVRVIDKEEMAQGYKNMAEINKEEANAGIHTLNDGLKDY
jgi:phage gp29-like protein